MIKLDTGKAFTPVVEHRDGAIPVGYTGEVIAYDDTTPSEQVVYPSHNRRLLLVEPGQMTVVTAYNLRGDDRIVFSKILRSNGMPAWGTPECCPVITIARSIRLHAVELPCWLLDRCNPVFVLKTPGAYEVDARGDDIIDVVVTATSFPLQEVNTFGACQCPPDPTG